MPTTVSKTNFDEFNTFSVITDQEIKKKKDTKEMKLKTDDNMKKKPKS